MALDPLQRGVGEDEVIRFVGNEARDVALLEAKRALCQRHRLFEHRVRRVDAERTRRAEFRVQPRRELAGAAAEVDDAHRGFALDHRSEVVEGLGAFLPESLVLVGIPGARGLRHRSAPPLPSDCATHSPHVHG